LINRLPEKPKLQNVNSEILNRFLDELKVDYKNSFLCHHSFRQSVYADCERLKIILRNLVENGIHYGQRVELLIDEPTASQTRVIIKDHGPGIALVEQDIIFKEFYRSANAKRTRPDGLGLGLAIVRRLSQEMQAQVWIDNPGQPGAIFVFAINNRK